MDFASCTEFTNYLKTKGEAHPMLNGGAATMSDAKLAAGSAKHGLAKAIAEGAHYGALSLVNAPSKKAADETLEDVPTEVRTYACIPC